MSDFIFEVKNLNKTFGMHTVLKDINFNVSKGEVVSIIGSSGSGKSTMLRCLNLLEEPSGGDILYNGESILSKGFNTNIMLSPAEFHLLARRICRRSPCGSK